MNTVDQEFVGRGSRLILAALLLVACSQGSSGVGGSGGMTSDPFSGPAVCTSDAVRDPNESEGPEMMPGHACTPCHAQSNAATGENDAPIFAFAGTIYPTGHEPDNCVGSAAEGAEVTITDASGKTWTATANHSGNFFLEDAPTFRLPLRARVDFQGRTRTMALEQNNGDCNSCHTQFGLEGAPGRIVLP